MATHPAVRLDPDAGALEGGGEGIVAGGERALRGIFSRSITCLSKCQGTNGILSYKRVAMDQLSLDRRLDEFNDNVWDHTQDAFQLNFDLRRPLDPEELELLTSLTDAIREGMDDDRLAKELTEAIDQDEARLFILMQQAGLTRNKIVTDLKAAAAQTGVKISSSPATLLRSKAGWSVAAPYLAARLRKTLEPLMALEDPSPAFEAVNQSTWPHWIRQERAKRQGHEAEYRVAVVLDALDIPFVPPEKAENPLCRDAQIDGISYDLVVPDITTPALVLKSTVQTSNIGQFGESKAHLEVSEAAEMLASSPGHRPLLIALVDGIGFRSNIAGLKGVLATVDEFCQFKTLWKAPVVAASCLGLDLEIALPAGIAETHSDFLGRYGTSGVSVYEATEDLRSEVAAAPLVDAGEGFLWRD